MPRLATSVAGLVLAACGVDTGQERVSVPLFVSGTQPEGSLEAPGAVQVTLERARLAFGPLYLCAGPQAGDFCETARLEWLDSVVVDVLDGDATRAGELQGVSGTVRSWMFDLGVTSTLTQPGAYELQAATELDGASVVLEGTAHQEGVELPFSFRLDVDPSAGGKQGVVLVHKSPDDDFARDVTQNEPGLLVRFDASSWAEALDLRAYFDRATCADGATVACNGATAQRCAEDGTVEREVECSDAERCAASVGCVETLELDSPQLHSAVRNAIVAGRHPSFQWGYAP